MKYRVRNSRCSNQELLLHLTSEFYIEIPGLSETAFENFHDDHWHTGTKRISFLHLLNPHLKNRIGKVEFRINNDGNNGCSLSIKEMYRETADIYCSIADKKRSEIFFIISLMKLIQNLNISRGLTFSFYV